MTLYGDTKVWINIDLGNALLSDSTMYHAITWTNVDLPSVSANNIHLRAISQDLPQPSVTKFSLKINYQKFYLNLQAANKLTDLFCLGVAVVCSRLTREVRPLQSAGLCVNSYNSSAALLQLLEETAANQPCKEDTLEEPEETIDILSMGKDVDSFTVSLHSPNGRWIAWR